MQKGIIEIENMEFYAFHGCYEQEKIVGNRFLVDLVFETDVKAAVQSDNIVDAVSYLEVYEVVKKQMEIGSNLLENVAQRIIDSCMEHFYEIVFIKVKVSKMNPPLGGQVGSVSITLSKSK